MNCKRFAAFAAALTLIPFASARESAALKARLALGEDDAVFATALTCFAIDRELGSRGDSVTDRINALLTKDLYVLTPWHCHTNRLGWTAFAYDDPEKGEAVVFALRLKDAKKDTFVAKLPFVDSLGVYEVKNENTGATTLMSGPELSETGYAITLPQPRSSALLRVKAVGKRTVPQNPTWGRISRTMERIQRSTPEKPETVRVLFYGQSIVGQNWGPRFIIPALQKRYPSVKFVVENRAIGGYQAPQLIKTAESDLFPFYPDLLFFHVYGPSNDYRRIVGRVRARTTADIVLWTSHLDAEEGATPEKVAKLLAEPDLRSQNIRRTADRYGCMFIDLRSKWCRMLLDRKMPAKDLLRDGVHLKSLAFPIYADFLSEDILAGGTLEPNPKAGAVTTHPAARKFDFTGNRVTAIADGATNAEYEVLLDGKPVQAWRESWMMTRPSKFPSPDAWTPAMDRICVGPTVPVEETWTLMFRPGADAEGKVIPFLLMGSVSGEEGTGISTNAFVSKSGRVSIPTDSWCLPWWWGYFKVKPAPGMTVTWQSKPLVAATYRPGAKGERTVLVQACPNGRHTLELVPKKEGPLGIANFIVDAPAPADE